MTRTGSHPLRGAGVLPYAARAEPKPDPTIDERGDQLLTYTEPKKSRFACSNAWPGD